MAATPITALLARASSLVLHPVSRNTCWVFGERISNSVLNLLAIVAIGRMLGPVAYGHFAFAISILGIALATGQLGLDSLLIKKLIEQPQTSRTLLGTIALMKYLIYIPVSIGIAGYALINTTLTMNESILLFILSSLCLTSPISTNSLAWLNANQNFSSTSIRRIAATLFGTSAKLMIILAGGGIVQVAAAHAGMFVLEMVLLYHLLRSRNGPPITTWQFQWNTSIKLIKDSGYLFVGSIFAMVYVNCDVIILRLLKDPLSVGIYAPSQQIILSAQLLPYAITLVAFPLLLKLHLGDAIQFRIRTKQIAWILIVSGTALASIIAISAPYIIPAVFGPEYQSTVLVIQIASIGLPFLFMRQLTTKLFICFGHSRRFAAFELAILLLSISSNYLLIAHHGISGAAMATVLTFMPNIAIYFYLLRKA